MTLPTRHLIAMSLFRNVKAIPQIEAGKLAAMHVLTHAEIGPEFVSKLSPGAYKIVAITLYEGIRQVGVSHVRGAPTKQRCAN